MSFFSKLWQYLFPPDVTCPKDEPAPVAPRGTIVAEKAGPYSGSRIEKIDQKLASSPTELVEFTIVAVSRLGQGICVAGIRGSSGAYEWIRPTRQVAVRFQGLEDSDLYNLRGELITKVGSRVRWEISGKMKSEGPHIEDYCHPGGGAKTLVKELTHKELLTFMARYEEHESANFCRFLNNEVSLTFIRPARVDDVLMDCWRGDKYQPRVRFTYANESFDYSVTDLGWYGFFRSCQEKGTFFNDSYHVFTRIFGVRFEYLVLGSGQEFRGKHWPFIIGVICDKPLPVLI